MSGKSDASAAILTRSLLLEPGTLNCASVLECSFVRSNLTSAGRFIMGTPTELNPGIPPYLEQEDVCNPTS